MVSTTELRWRLCRYAVPWAVVGILFATASACDDEESLPEAESWEAPAPLPSQAGAAEGDPPHAGMQNAPGGGGAGSNPHAGMQNPHAGMENAPEGSGTPHAGMQNAQMQEFDAPDPNRSIDPNKYLRGTLRATEEVSSRIERGDIVFLSAKPIDPASGEVIGAPLAVDRIIVSELPVEFELSEENMMVAGTSFEGTVMVEARVDGDGEAMTRLPGDVEGTVQAEIPADDLDLALDGVVE